MALSAKPCTRCVGTEKIQIADFYAHVRNASAIRCYWCRTSVPRSKRHVDHIIPLARGGPHALANLCCACQSCNSRKGAKMPHEFTPQAEIAFGKVA